MKISEPSTAGTVPLETVVFTSELALRPRRAPDHETENRMLVSLAQALVDAPRSVLQVLAETLRVAMKADSAGISLLSEDGQRFYWPAIAGLWQAHIGGGTPRDFGACGDVFDRNAPMLFKHPERRYPYLLPFLPSVAECLLVPFQVGSKLVGTVWAMAHDAGRQFDTEDLRQLESLSRFASTAYLAMQAIDAARDSEERYRTVFESVGDGFCIIEKVQGEAGQPLDFRYVEANPSFELQSGLGGVVGRTVREVLPDEAEEWLLTYDAVLQTGEAIKFERGLVAQGRVLELHAFRVEYATRHCVGVSFKDITERNRAEEQLRRNRDTFFNLVENAPFGLYVVDAQFRLRHVSAAAQKVFSHVHPLIGRDFDEVLRCVWADPFASEAIGRFHHTLQTGEAYAAPNTTQLRNDIPDVESYDWKIERITLPDGQFGVVCYFYDVTERKLAEDALREREAFTSSIIKSSPDCIKVLDLEGTLLSMESGQELLGIDDIEPFLNTSWIDFWEGEHRQAAQAAVKSAAAGEAARFVGFFRTLRGEPKWWDISVSLIPGFDGQPARLLSVSRDVTQRKQTESNLAFLETISRDLAKWSSVDGMMRTLGVEMAAFLQLSRCAFAEIDETAEQAVINHEWHREDMPSLVGVHRLADFVGDEFIRYARAGEVIVVRDAGTDPRTDPAKFAALKIASFLCIPLIQDGRWRFALCLYKSVPYDWRKDEIELTGELAARIWTRIEGLGAEAALRQSEQRFRTLFESIDEGFCTVEMIFDERKKPVDWRFLEVNPAFSALTGVVDAVGKRMRQLAPDYEAHWFETYGKVALTGESIRFVDQPEALDGRWFDVYAFKVGGPESLKVGVLFNNISERKATEEALRQSEERFRSMFDSGPIAMYSVDAAGTIQEFNRNAVTLWGRQPKAGALDERYCGACKLHLPDGTALPHSQTPVAAVLRGDIAAAHDVEVVMERPDGSRINVIANVVSLKNGNGEIIGAVVSLYDITERSRLESKLQEQADALIDLDRRKDEFLAMLSHELRNPLAPLSNAVHMLRLQENEQPLQRHARNIIERQVGQLQHLVGDLLEISRITTGRVQLRLEQVTMRGIVERAIETTEQLFAQHRHVLTMSMPPQSVWLHADAARLEQVLVNLLTNAAKYTDEGGRIGLKIEVEGETVVMRVSDNGIGIAPELLPRIFDLFTQAERSIDRSQGGLGIGLCLVQRLVELHGGTATADSVLGQGSEFTVRLPASVAAIESSPSTVTDAGAGADVDVDVDVDVETEAVAEAVAEAEAAQPSERSRRVLVVDDNVDLVESLVVLLKMFGHTVWSAHDGPAAIEVARSQRPDVVFLDIGLPLLNGYEVAKRLRQQAALANVVLVAMTGYGQETDRQLSREAGFDHHLVKPADFAAVQEILARAPVLAA